MTFTKNMPLPDDFLSVSEGEFLINNGILVDSVNTDHVTLEDGDAVERMKHKIVKLKDQTTNLPYVTLSDEGALYTKVVGGQDDLYYKHFNDGTEVKLTSGGSTGGNVLAWGAFQLAANQIDYNLLGGSNIASFNGGAPNQNNLVFTTALSSSVYFPSVWTDSSIASIPTTVPYVLGGTRTVNGFTVFFNNSRQTNNIIYVSVIG